MRGSANSGSHQKQRGNHIFQRREPTWEPRGDGFTVLLDEQKVICPQGVESKHFHIDPRKKLSASFPQHTCAICPHRETCKPNLRGKIYEQKVENKTLNERREKLNDPVYKKDLHHRNGIEGTLSGFVRGQRMRQSRYRGMAKSRPQMKMTGAAANIVRLSICRQREIDKHHAVSA